MQDFDVVFLFKYNFEDNGELKTLNREIHVSVGSFAELEAAIESYLKIPFFTLVSFRCTPVKLPF